MLKNWYVLQVNESIEIGVRRGLFHLGVEPLRLTKFERGRNGAPPRLVPLFPGYFFVRLDLAEDRWSWALEVPGTFGYLVDECGWPRAVEDGVIEEIQQRFKLVNDTTMAIPSGHALRPITVGQHVKILAGPFAKVAAIIEKADQKTVSVLVEIFGRSSLIELQREQVAASG